MSRASHGEAGSHKRRPQRAGRKHLAVADAAAAVHHHDRAVLAQRRILEAVVHHDRARPRRARRVRAGGTVACNDGRREPGEQQRLVADIGGSVLRWVDPHRARERAAVAAAEHNRPPSGPGQNLRDRNRRRRLAGAAQGQVADTDDGDAGGASRLGHPPCRDRSVSGSQRRQQAGDQARRTPPERRLTSCPHDRYRPHHPFGPRAAPGGTAPDRDRAQRRCVSSAPASVSIA